MNANLRFLIAWAVVIAASTAIADERDKLELQTARTEYEQATPRDKAARLRYVTKLAQIEDRLVSEYIASGSRNDQEMDAISGELKKHPAPADSDGKKLSQLLVGKWQSPRHVYVFRANGKYGNEDGPISSNWRIKGNQLIEDGSHGTIILLNDDYFIYSERDSVYFHSRVKE